MPALDPKDRPISVTARLERADYDKLCALARRKGWSLSKPAERAIRAYLKISKEPK